MLLLFYEVHIGDELKTTQQLSSLEFGIFARLRSKYIASGPMTEAVMRNWLRISSVKEKAAFNAVLTSFFKRRRTLYRSDEFDAERQRIQIKSEKARTSANTRWDAGKSDANALRAHSRRSAKAMLDNLATEPTKPNEPSEPSSTHPKDERALDAMALEVATAMKNAGVAQANPGDSLLLLLLAQGATVAEFKAAAETAVKQGKSFEWALARVKGKRADAAASQPVQPTQPEIEWFNSPKLVQQKAAELGVGPWIQFDSSTGKTEPWPSYLKRVLDHVNRGQSAP